MLYLMRHGHTELNALHEVHGRIDDPLDERGLAQAAALGQLFAGVPLTAVYASPLQRAHADRRAGRRGRRVDGRGRS